MKRKTIFIAFACAAICLTGSPAFAASSDYFLKLEGVPDKSDILAYGWGPARDVDSNGVSDALTDGLLIVRGAVPGPMGRGLDIARVNGQGPAHKDKLPVVAVDHEVTSPRDSASGQASGKRMHKPRWVYEPDPLGAAGNLTVKAAVPNCAPGQRYGGAQFAAGGKVYELSDVVIAGCARDAVSLNYRKVTVKGWNPEKKED